MSNLGKIHYVIKEDRNDLKAAVKAFHYQTEDIRKYYLPDRNETVCGKIMQPKYVSSKITSVTCNDCLNKLKSKNHVKLNRNIRNINHTLDSRLHTSNRQNG